MRFLLLMALFCAPLWAGEVEIGKPAPKFNAAGKLINPYEFARTNTDCAGDVVLVFEWSMGDLNTRGALPKVQQYWKSHGGKGLWIFGIHRLRKSARDVQQYVKTGGLEFCVPMGGFYDDSNDFSRYRHDDGIFRFTVIGVDGNVVFYDKKGYEPALEAELKKLSYPGLGKHEVAQPLVRTAKMFGGREFGKALIECEKLLAGEPTAAVREDAELIAKRATELAEKRNAGIKAWVEDRRYDLAIASLETMFTEFRHHKIGDEAKVELDRLKKDKDVKRELDGFRDLQRMIERTESQGDPMLLNALRRYAKDWPALRASGVASDMAKQIEEDSKVPN